MKFLKMRSKEVKELQPEAQENAASDENIQAPVQAGDDKYGPPSKLPEIKRALPRPAPRVASSSGSPPLFIKVDKYREIVKGIRELRSYILNLKDTLDVLSDMQREVGNGVQIAHKSLDELNSLVSDLDSFFMKPQTVSGSRIQEYDADDIEDEADTHANEIRSSMKDVYGQLEKLRAQLRSIQ
ncbi:MAG: hypothetical protein NTU57_04825 [Candidatus Aenigmarchaeota archaeon]|nr:hypothetical protein [Candidatus Aenigmarchaeota archaeon]